MVYKGSTVRIKATLTDYDGTALTPDSQEVKIYDSNGILRENNTSPTNLSEGVYCVDYTVPEDAVEGTWKVVWKAVKEMKPHINVLNFEVTAP